MEISNLFVYLAILFAKVIEVSIGTLRIVLITKGERLVGAMLGFFEVLIWVAVVGNVLKDISDDPFKMIIYALGFSIGNYMGSFIEGKLAFGSTTIMSVIKDEEDCPLISILRENGFAVTVIDGEGRDSKKKVLMIFIKRKNLEKVLKIIRTNQPDAVITTSDIRPASKMFGMIKK